MEPAFLVAKISTGSAILPIIVAANRWRSLESESRSIAILAIASLVCDVTMLVLGANRINSWVLGNAFMLLQVSLLMRVYSFQYRSTRPLVVVFVCLAVIYVVNTAFFEGPWKLNTAFHAGSSLVMIALSLHYFYKLLSELPTLHIHKLSMLWISFAVLFYFGGNVFQFLVSNYIVADDVVMGRKLWILHNLLNILKNALFTIAIWQSYRRMNSSLSS